MKNMRLVLSVLCLAGASAYAQNTTNFFADFEGSAPGPVTNNAIMNDGTVLGGTWSSTNWNWDSSASAIVTNATNAAFNFRANRYIRHILSQGIGKKTIMTVTAVIPYLVSQ